MARLHIALPEKKPLATIHIPVRITDINYGNHLGNDSLVSMIHESRMQFLTGHGFTELSVGNTSLIMSDLAVQYKNEAFYGDRLQVEIFSGEVSKVSFELIYKISTTRQETPLIVAIGKTTMVGFNYDLKKVSALPHELTSIFM